MSYQTLLLCLRIKGWVLNEAVDEDPQVSLDVKWLQCHPSLVLLLGSLEQLPHHLVHHVVDVSTPLECGGRRGGRGGRESIHVYINTV